MTESGDTGDVCPEHTIVHKNKHDKCSVADVFFWMCFKIYFRHVNSRGKIQILMLGMVNCNALVNFQVFAMY